MSNLLEIKGLTAFYGSAQAVFDVSLTMQRGETLALMGRNGMGKSTTIKSLCRMLPNTGGDIAFEGVDLTRLPAHRAARLGLGLVPEGRRCFASLTVDENLRAAARKGHWSLARVGDLFPRLAERSSQRASSLSGGEQQMLAIGRALMTNPKLLILDEATEGLAPLVRAEIWAALSALKSTGLSILIVDKSLKELGQFADRAVMLDRGRNVWSGPMTQIPSEITDKYLGV